MSFYVYYGQNLSNPVQPVYMKNIPFYLLVLIVAVAQGCGNKNALLKEADKCINDSDYKKAILLCNEVLAEDSTEYDAYNTRGYSFQCLKDYKNAMADFSSSIHFNKKGYRGYLFRAMLLSKQQRYEYSLPDFTVALKYITVDSIKEKALVNRAVVYCYLRKFENAVEDLRTALKYNPNDVFALTNMGQAIAQTGKTSEGISYLEKVIEIDSTFEGGYLNLAFAYSTIGDDRKSLEINNKLLSLYPDQSIGLNNRGYSKMQLNDFDGAMTDINRSIQLEPGNSYAFRNRGLLYLKLKKNDEACADFQTAIKLDFTQYYGNEVEELVRKYCAK